MINLICDATIGVLLQYLFLHIMEVLVKDTKFEFHTGDYGVHNWNLTSYLYQLGTWILIVWLSKFCNVGILFIFYSFFERFGKFILTPLSYSNKVKLIFVMIVYPLAFTILQLWITDNFIKKQKEDNVENNGDLETAIHSPLNNNEATTEIHSQLNNNEVVENKESKGI
jgi:hypothetical protein